MSASDQSEKNKVKDIRRGVLEQPAPVSGRKGGKKPYNLVGDLWVWKDRTISKFARLADAEKALAAYSARKSYANLRIEGPLIRGRVIITHGNKELR